MSLTQRITQNWYARADRLQDYWRDFAFLGLDEELRIAGQKHPVRVRQLTLRMFIQLCAVRSPFLVGGRVGPEHVSQILWRLSPEYDRRHEPVSPTESDIAAAESLTQSLLAITDVAERARIEAQIQVLLHPTMRFRHTQSIAGLPFKSTTRAISRYLDRMLIDKPPSSEKPNGKRPDTSFAASMVHTFAKVYGWSDDVILDLPMPRLFQQLRKIHRDSDPDMACFNPLRARYEKYVSDKVLAAREARREELNHGLHG